LPGAADLRRLPDVVAGAVIVLSGGQVLAPTMGAGSPAFSAAGRSLRRRVISSRWMLP